MEKQIVTFNLNKQSKYAFDINDVDSINKKNILSDLAVVPKSNKNVLGIFTYRKKAIPCIDLNGVLNIKKDYEDERVVVVNHNSNFIAFITGSKVMIKKTTSESEKEIPDVIKNKNLQGLYVDDEIYTLLNIQNLIDENLVAC